MSDELDQRVRLAAFQWLRAQMDVIGEVLPRSVLGEGFVLDGRRVPLLGPQGIFKPQVMTEAPLSTPRSRVNTAMAWDPVAFSVTRTAGQIRRTRTTVGYAERWSGSSRGDDLIDGRPVQPLMSTG